VILSGQHEAAKARRSNLDNILDIIDGVAVQD
jgi:hypothetical protein